MTLGSPVGSPAQSPGTPSSNSAYLPSFLLGDANVSARLGASSPQDLRFSTSHLPSPMTPYGSPDYRINRQKAMFGGTTSPNGVQIGMETHASGPPTRALFDTLETSQSAISYGTAVNQSINNQSRLPSTSLNNSLFLESPINRCAGDSQGLLQWVTVFGFPPSALNNVLSYISSRVRILDKHCAPQPQSNWIHLKCASEVEAQRALACNGNIVSGSIMIGVIPCTDEGVILDVDKENRSKLNGSIRLFSTPGRGTQMPECSTPRTPTRIQGARPLAAGYNPNVNPQAVRSTENIPQKSTGLVSKAMEYVFGW